MKKIVVFICAMMACIFVQAQDKYYAYSYVSKFTFVLSSADATFQFDCSPNKKNETCATYRDKNGVYAKIAQIALPYMGYDMTLRTGSGYPIGSLINYLSKHGWEIQAGIPTVIDCANELFFSKLVSSDEEIFEGFEQMIQTTIKQQ